jgi:hypothetical protein
MPRILRAIGEKIRSRLNQKDTAPVNRYEGFQSNGAVVLPDRRGTRKAEILNDASPPPRDGPPRFNAGFSVCRIPYPLLADIVFLSHL